MIINYNDNKLYIIYTIFIVKAQIVFIQANFS